MENLNREQTIALVGNSAVELLDKENCEYYGQDMLSYNQETEIWTASVMSKSIESGIDVRVTAYYYQHKDNFYRDGNAIEDLSELDWVIDHYTVN